MTIKFKRYFFILIVTFFNNLNATDCSDIREISRKATIINQPFSAYKTARGEQPIKLLFPGGRDLLNPKDRRADQQKHHGFYTIDIDEYHPKKINPHLKGDIFNESVWSEIENNTLDLTHIEVPGELFLYGYEDNPGRKEKDDFILRKVNEKSKIGAKLFVDLRYSRFWPLPSPDVPKNLLEANERIREFKAEDCDFFVDWSYTFNREHLASYWHQLLGLDQEEIKDILNKNAESEVFNGDREKLENLEKLVDQKLESMTEEELYNLWIPYIIFFDRKTRDHIFQKYDALFGKYGFQRSQPIIEVHEKINRNMPFQHPLQRVDELIVYEGMCFLDAISEYEKVKDLHEF
jgi:hypothetical protein